MSTLLAVIQHEGGRITGAEFSPDGTRVLTASDDRTARIWDAQTGTQIMPSLEDPGGMHRAAYSPDGRFIATVTNGGTVLWNAQTGKLLVGPLNHNAIVCHVAFSSDGTRVVAASADGTAAVWSAQTGERLAGPCRTMARFSSQTSAPSARASSPAAKTGRRGYGTPTPASLSLPRSYTAASYSTLAPRLSAPTASASPHTAAVLPACGTRKPASPSRRWHSWGMEATCPSSLMV